MAQPNSVITIQDRARIVQESIDEIKEIFQQFPDIFLTEEDVRSHLFAKLLAKGLSAVKVTEDNSRSIELHSEVRWYGRRIPRMKSRSDIVVLDASTLVTTVSGSIRLPSKQYGFGGFFATIEIKLRRSDRESNAAFLEKISEDIAKLEKIRRYVQTDFDGYILVFDKGPGIEQNVLALTNDRYFKIIYSHSNPADRNWTQKPTASNH